MRAPRTLLGPLVGAVAVCAAVGVLGGVTGTTVQATPATRPAVAFEPNGAAFSADRPHIQLRKPSGPKPEAATPRPRPTVVADIAGELPITARPGGGRVVGAMPAGSRYFDEPLHAALLERTPDGRFGRVPVPYSGSRATGWIRLDGLPLSTTPYSVQADLSNHEITVEKLGKVILRVPAATGAADSPTPPGHYFVTDRVAIEPGGSFGSFAFGLSGIQTNLPAGWSGGDQLAIHGTQDPSSIGTSASAGCLRVSERTLDRLKPLLQLGTPVTIKP